MVAYLIKKVVVLSVCVVGGNIVDLRRKRNMKKSPYETPARASIVLQLGCSSTVTVNEVDGSFLDFLGEGGIRGTFRNEVASPASSVSDSSVNDEEKRLTCLLDAEVNK